MATVTITVTDSPTGGVTVVVEGKNPVIPLIDAEGTPDVERLTDAHAVALGALMAICDQVGELDYRVLLKS